MKTMNLKRKRRSKDMKETIMGFCVLGATIVGYLLLGLSLYLYGRVKEGDTSASLVQRMWYALVLGMFFVIMGRLS